MVSKEMYFKGKKVFVEVDGSGKVLLDGGKATMRYTESDERTYHPWPANLSDEPRETPREPARKSSVSNFSAGPESLAIVAYTDGACLGNPGLAGLGFSILFPDGGSISRGEPLGNATNNIAELTAILRVLEIVEQKTETLIIHTDSSYSIGVLTKGWKAKANQELIQRIRSAMASFPKLRLVKVKGHAGDPQNERVDELAKKAASSQRNWD